MEPATDTRQAYRKLAFSAARRTSDDLAELFARFFAGRHLPGSQLGQLLACASDTQPLRERLAAEGITDIDAFFAGQWNHDGELGDLALECYLVGDASAEEQERITVALHGSPEGRELLDRLLKQRLIFLADHPAAGFLEKLAEIQARAPIQPAPPRPRWRRKRVVTAATGGLVAALLAWGVWRPAEPQPATAAAPDPSSGADDLAAAAPDPSSGADDLAAATRLAATRAGATPNAPEPTSTLAARKSARDERVRGARLLVYARRGGEVRPVEDGREIGADERVVAWVKTPRAAHAAVVAVNGERVRVLRGDEGHSLPVPAGGPTRLGRAKPLPAAEVELLLLIATEPFELEPILHRLRRGASVASVFHGTIRRLRLRRVAVEVAATTR